MSTTSFGERVLTASYRLMLLLYPRSFRADFARDMTETFIDRYRDARRRGVRAVVALIAASAADATFNGLRERLHPHRFGYGMFHWVDVRYVLRLLRRSPGFSALTVLTLAGGLGISIFTFAFLHTAMLAPLPLPDGERIVRVENAQPSTAGMFDVTDVRAIRPSLTTLSTVGAYTTSDFVIGDDRHRRVLGATLAEPNIFEVTATRPMLGRTFSADDQAVGAEQVIVLSHRTWLLAFGGDSTVVGRSVPLNAGFARIIGVMPPGYGFPVASDAWLPLPMSVLVEQAPNVQAVDLYARLANGATSRAASVELARLIDRVHAARASTPDRATRAAVDVRSFPMAQIGDDAPLALSVLNLLATLILLLACVNVTNLLLARANERARETAVRLALGASRGRLVMQSMWENVIICLLGGLIATAATAWGLDIVNRWLQSNLEGNLAFWWVWKLDRTAVYSGCAFVTGVVAFLGCVVSGRVMGAEFNAVLRDGGARSGNRREGRIARVLVVTQVSVVTVLMFFGVLSSIVAYRVAHADIGYDTRRLLSATVDLPAVRYDSVHVRRAFYRRLVSDLGANSAVEAPLVRASIASISDADAAFEFAANRRAFDQSSPRAYVDGVAGPLATLGITVRSGRMLDDRDDERGAAIAVISRSLAEQVWPGRSPIGQRIRLATDSGRVQSREIVGVVSDILFGGPFSRARSAAAIYLPLAQTNVPRASLLFRHRGDAPAARAALYASLARIDSHLSPPNVQTFDEILTKSALIATSVTKLFAVCFGFALLLAVSGTYGLMARSIGQRTREIGVRRALGATDGVVARLLVGQGSRQLGVGVGIALPLLVGIGIGFSSFFPLGWVTALVSGVLVSGSVVGVVLLATYLPTRRALAIPVRDALWRE
ncbi:MAG TPA: ABC transporter permease [Gemmatimonadaceae bacterium]|jgi:predicted permease